MLPSLAWSQFFQLQHLLVVVLLFFHLFFDRFPLPLPPSPPLHPSSPKQPAPSPTSTIVPSGVCQPRRRLPTWGGEYSCTHPLQTALLTHHYTSVLPLLILFLFPGFALQVFDLSTECIKAPNVLAVRPVHLRTSLGLLVDVPT